MRRLQEDVGGDAPGLAAGMLWEGVEVQDLPSSCVCRRFCVPQEAAEP